MSRASLVLLPLTALLAGLLGATAPGAGPWVATLGAAAVALAVWRRTEQRVENVAREVNRWAGDAVPAPLRLDDSHAWRSLATAVNVVGDELQAAREGLRSRVSWTDRLVSSLDEPAFVFGADGRLAASNPAAAELSHLALEEGTATALTAIGSAAMAQAAEEARLTGTLVALTDERAGRELRITASPLDDHVLVVVSDRTRERRVEALRRDFVINASHELKTPVTAIAALTEAMRVAPPERREGLLDRLDEETDRLVRLVRDLLDLRLLDEETGAERAAVDLAALAREAAHALREAAATGDVELELLLPPSAVVVGVERELRLVLVNLVSNAVQYTERGGTVTVTLEQDGGDQVLRVRDTGVGIPASAVERIFERFYRVDVARSRARGGTGLGLAIVRNAVERHGGRIAVESLLGVGTTFTVRLPVEPAAG